MAMLSCSPAGLPPRTYASRLELRPSMCALPSTKMQACRLRRAFNCRVALDVDVLGMAFQSSTHERFASIGPKLLLPVVQLINGHVARGMGGDSNLSPADTAPDVRDRGRSWVLLGAARLALVAPSAGTDPARKAALKQLRLRDFVDRELKAEIEVRRGNAGLANASVNAPAVSRASSRTAISGTFSLGYSEWLEELRT